LASNPLDSVQSIFLTIIQLKTQNSYDESEGTHHG
jgi:hypothetical protein